MDKYIIGSVDCAFDNTGWSVCEYNPETKEIHIKSANTITKDKIVIPEDIKLKTFSDLYITSTMMQELEKELFKNMKSLSDQADGYKWIIGMEVQSGSQSARAAACLGMAKGILSGLINEYVEVAPEGSRYYEFTPGEVKKCVTKDATKDDIMEWTILQFPQIGKTEKGKYAITFQEGMIVFNSKSVYEHIADSLVITKLIVENLEKENKCTTNLEGK